MITKPITIGIFGITGRMGRAIVDVAAALPEVIVTVGKASPHSSLAGERVLEAQIVADAGDVVAAADVLIDFSHAEAVMDHLDLAVAAGKPMVIGVTGLNDEQHERILTAAASIPVVYAANTSIGVTVLTSLVEQAAKVLDLNFDIEVFEAHHRHKVDAPSGTALQLGQAAARGRVISHEAPLIRGGGQRGENEIGYAVQRGGGIVGEHSVRFISDDEIVELSHRSLSRHLFARGALKAAIWLAQRPAGHLYSMRDVLGV